MVGLWVWIRVQFKVRSSKGGSDFYFSFSARAGSQQNLIGANSICQGFTLVKTIDLNSKNI
jgi:hypothetical protein